MIFFVTWIPPISFFNWNSMSNSNPDLVWICFFFYFQVQANKTGILRSLNINFIESQVNKRNRFFDLSFFQKLWIVNKTIRLYLLFKKISVIKLWKDHETTIFKNFLSHFRVAMSFKIYKLLKYKHLFDLIVPKTLLSRHMTRLNVSKNWMVKSIYIKTKWFQFLFLSLPYICIFLNDCTMFAVDENKFMHNFVY